MCITAAYRSPGMLAGAEDVGLFLIGELDVTHLILRRCLQWRVEFRRIECGRSPLGEAVAATTGLGSITGMTVSSSPGTEIILSPSAEVTAGQNVVIVVGSITQGDDQSRRAWLARRPSASVGLSAGL
jgi:hypothetical protein